MNTSQMTNALKVRRTLVLPRTLPIHKPLPQPPVTPQAAGIAQRKGKDEAQSDRRGPRLDAALEGSRTFAERNESAEQSSRSGKGLRRLGFVPPPPPDIRHHRKSCYLHHRKS